MSSLLGDEHWKSTDFAPLQIARKGKVKQTEKMGASGGSSSHPVTGRIRKTRMTLWYPNKAFTMAFLLTVPVLNVILANTEKSPTLIWPTESCICIRTTKTAWTHLLSGYCQKRTKQEEKKEKGAELTYLPSRSAPVWQIMKWRTWQTRSRTVKQLESHQALKTPETGVFASQM